jgi:predicted Rossmann fold nucleotide-binding protein DprA/Smf involved in DNA uptake
MMESSEQNMTELFSDDTQAALLLCSRLGRVEDNGVKPLSAKQYSALARWLHERSMRPADLMNNRGRSRLAELQIPDLTQEGVEALLDRGAALGIMTERWTSRGLWVLSRGDAAYPNRFKGYMGQAAPPLLFGTGNPKLLQTGGLAMVGSRDASEEDIEFARRVAAACASQGIAAISGGARGIDLESMATAFEAGGCAIGVLPDSLWRTTVSARYREGIISGRLTLVSPYDPDARWFAFTAMERNKLIYALSDAALVVSSAVESGGTWAGAVEALDSQRITVYVKIYGAIQEGNRKLLGRGAVPFPKEPWTDLKSLFVQPRQEATLFSEPAATSEPSLPEVVPQSTGEDHVPLEHLVASKPEESRAGPPRDVFAIVLPELLLALEQPRTEKEIQQSLGVVLAQVRAWLKRACEEGQVRKMGRPLRYVATAKSPQLFDGIEGSVRNSRPHPPS